MDAPGEKDNSRYNEYICCETFDGVPPGVSYYVKSVIKMKPDVTFFFG